MRYRRTDKIVAGTDQFEITGKPERKEIWDYPLEALREAVINAICYRDYIANEEIQIKIYDDRITEEKFGGFLVEFRKDLYTEEYLKELGLNERQIKAVMYVRRKVKSQIRNIKNLIADQDRCQQLILLTL